MTVWAVRAGKLGEGESFALENTCLVAGWESVGDLSGVTGREEIRRMVGAAHPEASPGLLANWAGQLLAFRTEIKKGDLVILPRKGTGTLAIGEATDGYRFQADAPPFARHQQKCRWLDTAFPRSRLDQDILFSLGSILTVFKVRRSDAEKRIRMLLTAKPAMIETPPQDVWKSEDRDFRTNALDQIRSRITQRFKGHKLAGLVEAVLRARGYETRQSPPGPDGGVDIIATRGFFGGEDAKLVVQVKSDDRPTDAPTVRQLIGVMDKFGAQRGLFVSWSGFKTSVDREFERDFFRLQFWNGDKLMEEIFRSYDAFDETLKAQLPLERIFVLLPDEDLEP
jgi:restriction system protein